MGTWVASAEHIKTSNGPIRSLSPRRNPHNAKCKLGHLHWCDGQNSHCCHGISNLKTDSESTVVSLNKYMYRYWFEVSWYLIVRVSPVFLYLYSFWAIHLSLLSCLHIPTSLPPRPSAPACTPCIGPSKAHQRLKESQLQCSLLVPKQCFKNNHHVFLALIRVVVLNWGYKHIVTYWSSAICCQAA